MNTVQPKYSKAEFAERGDAIYERDVAPVAGGSHDGEYAAIDIETGAFEVDADELTASDRLLARVPNAQVWLRRIGSRYLRRSARAARGAIMISGRVTKNREAVIRLAVHRRDDHPQTIDAIVDTGFDGWLTLSPLLIAQLDLAWKRRGRALTADGNESIVDIYEATVIWDGQLRRVAVDEMDFSSLIGISLMTGYELRVQVRSGGNVSIAPLS